MLYTMCMTIHHDKLAYGKLKPNMEELSEDKLNEMLKQLSEDDDSENCDKPDEESKKIQKKL